MYPLVVNHSRIQALEKTLAIQLGLHQLEGIPFYCLQIAAAWVLPGLCGWGGGDEER